MLSINVSELIWTIVNFFLLYFLLKRFLFTPLGRFLDARQARLDEALKQEAEARAAAEEIETFLSFLLLLYHHWGSSPSFTS